jgi:hypothetical protein
MCSKNSEYEKWFTIFSWKYIKDAGTDGGTDGGIFKQVLRQIGYELDSSDPNKIRSGRFFFLKKKVWATL